tara:strand:+ start:22053 stop:22526 length:474 start_codon:yes stop_codon:yes gene_type:complete
MKIVKKIGLFLLIIFVIAQFFGPETNAGEYTSLDGFIAETNPPEDVKAIMKATCFDCHSNSTNYPWYFNVTPVNYWIADHIEEGKKELNFSKWSSYSLKRKEHKFDEIWEEVEKKKMPLDSYTWTHDDAKLSDEQIAVIVTWAKEIQANYKIQINAK